MMTTCKMTIEAMGSQIAGKDQVIAKLKDELQKAMTIGERKDKMIAKAKEDEAANVENQNKKIAEMGDKIAAVLREGTNQQI
jgi:hypothetical protein